MARVVPYKQTNKQQYDMKTLATIRLAIAIVAMAILPTAAFANDNLMYNTTYNERGQADTIVVYQKCSNGMYEPVYKHVYAYNDDALLQSDLTLAYSDGEWLNRTQYNYTYNGIGAISEVIVLSRRDGNRLQKRQKYSISTDHQSNLLGYTTYLWNNKKKAWEMDQKFGDNNLLAIY